MRRLLIYACGCILLASTARADILNLGDVTRDTRTNLDWLDLTQTTNLSIDDILANAGGFAAAGWRHANEAEMCELMESFGIAGSPCPQNGYSSTDLTPFLEFVALFGRTDINLNRSKGRFPPPSQTCTVLSPYPITIVGLASSSLGSAKVGNVCGNDAYEHEPTVGNFLVRPRPIPEPSTTLVLGPGFVLLAALRRFGKRR